MPRKCGKDGCPRRPLYGIPGKKGVFCGEHKTGDQMIDVVSRRCSHPGCGKRPLYGHAGGPPITCAAHKQPGMEDRKSRRCNGPECDTVPSYGYPGERASRCAAHRDAGMHNVVSSPCESLGCSARAAFASNLGERARFCEAHKAPQMVDVRARRCCHRGCARQSAFANPGERASACAMHRLDGMIEVKAAVREAEAAAAANQAAGIVTISPRRKEYAVPRLGGKAAFAEAALVVFQEALAAKHRADNGYSTGAGTAEDIYGGYSGASGGEDASPSPASPAFVPASSHKDKPRGRRRRLDPDGSEPPMSTVHYKREAETFGQGGSSSYGNGDGNGYGDVTDQSTGPVAKRQRHQAPLPELPLPPRQNNIMLTPPPSTYATGAFPTTADGYGGGYNGGGFGVWSARPGDLITGVSPSSPWMYDASAAEALLGPPPEHHHLQQQLPPSPLPPPPPPLPLPLRAHPLAVPTHAFPHSAGANVAGAAAALVAYNNMASPLLRQPHGNNGGSGQLFSRGSSGNVSAGHAPVEQMIYTPRAVRQRLPGVSASNGSSRANSSGRKLSRQPPVPPLRLPTTSISTPMAGMAAEGEVACLSTAAVAALEDDAGTSASTGGFWTTSPDDDSPLMSLSPGSAIWTPSAGGGGGNHAEDVDVAGSGGGSGGSDCEGGLSPIPVLPQRCMPLSLSSTLLATPSPPPPQPPQPACGTKQQQLLLSDGITGIHLPHLRKQHEASAAVAASAARVAAAAVAAAEGPNDAISLRPMLGSAAPRAKTARASQTTGNVSGAPEKASAMAAAAAANNVQCRRSPAPWESTTELLSPQGWLSAMSADGMMGGGDAFLVSPGSGMQMQFLEEPSVPV